MRTPVWKSFESELMHLTLVCFHKPYETGQNYTVCGAYFYLILSPTSLQDCVTVNTVKNNGLNFQLLGLFWSFLKLGSRVRSSMGRLRLIRAQERNTLPGCTFQKISLSFPGCFIVSERHHGGDCCHHLLIFLPSSSLIG